MCDKMEEKSEKQQLNMKKFIKEQKKTLPLKLVILCFSGGAICIFPFLVLQLQLIGLTINEIAAMFLIVPFGALLGPVISGLIADKIGKYSLVFLFNVVLGAISYNLLLIVPHLEPNTVSLMCNEGYLRIVYDDCNDCIRNLQINETTQQFLLKNCKPCEDDEDEIMCSEDLFYDYSCPVFHSIDEIKVNLTFSPEDRPPDCSFAVAPTSHFNTNIKTRQKCANNRCDYKCTAPKEIEDCIETPMLTDTFIYVAILMFTSNFFVAASFTMLDASILQIVKEQNASLGKQKIMNMLGFAFTPLLAGVLIDIHSKKVGYVSYFAAFMLSNALMICTCFVTYFVNMKTERNDSNILKDLGKLIISIEVDLFLLLVLILGCNFGFIESYLFIYLQSLDAPSFLLGLTMTVGCLASIPMLFWADWVDKKIGKHYIFVVCFTAYAARMFGYSFIHNPWMCLIFECFEAITYQLMYVTCLKLCPLLAPKGLLATMTGLTGSIHYSFGKGIGGFLGGHLINIYGMRNAFRIFGGFALCGGVFYIIAHYAFFKKVFEEKEREQAEQERASKVKEERKKMLDSNNDKCPSYSDLSTEEINLSYLMLAGPTRKFSVISVTLKKDHNEHNDNEDCEKQHTSEHNENHFDTKNNLSHSVPMLNVSNNSSIEEKLSTKNLSRSEHNIN